MSSLATPAIDIGNYRYFPIDFFSKDAPAVGAESANIRNQVLECIHQYLKPISRQSENVQLKFVQLKEKWKEDTSFLSSITDIVLHPSYQQIIGMGEKVVPIIIDELKNEHDHWFWALKAITGADPVPSEHRGDIYAMAEEWIRWWDENRPE